MKGTLIETKQGWAVETTFSTDDGTTYLHRRVVNGMEGRPTVGSEVRFSGHNTWSGIGFVVATDPYPDPQLTEIVPTAKPKKKKK